MGRFGASFEKSVIVLVLGSRAPIASVPPLLNVTNLTIYKSYYLILIIILLIVKIFTATFGWRAQDAFQFSF